EKRPIVAVLLDHSQSMMLPAGPFETEEAAAAVARAAGFAAAGGSVDAETRRALNQMSRAKLAHAGLRAAKETFATPLAERFDLRFYGVGDELTRIPTDVARADLPEPPDPAGKTSPLGAAVRDILDDAAGRPVAGMVLL